MPVRRLVLPLVAAIMVASCLASRASAEHYFDFTFYQSPITGGGVKYGLDISNQILNFTPNPPKPYQNLVAPDGTEFLLGGLHTLEGSTFDEIASRAFGTWKVTDIVSGVETHYTITIAPFNLDDVFTDVLIITSPTPGSDVPPKFRLSWEYQNGSIPRGFGWAVNHFPNVTGVTLVPTPGCCAVDVSATLYPPGSSGRFDLYVLNETRVSGISRQGGPSDSYSLSLAFQSRSVTASYTVVPEPNSDVLAVLGGVGVAVFGLVVWKSRG
jgi:hypothetical protein